MTNQDRTEVDMGYVQGFVNLIAQALVAATELPKQIEAMQTDLTTLHNDLDRTKQRNIELDTLTGDLRRQRDEAEQALSQAKTDLSITTNKFNDIEDHNSSLQGLVNSLRDDLTKAKSERDDYGLKHMAAEDRANEAEAKLKKLREALGMVETPALSKPEPTATSSGSPVSNSPMPEPINPSPKRLYEPHDTPQGTGDKWDNEKQSWYKEA